ncbi:hypothetical protein LTR56_018113 [Elasticomyces elasticus]|nr:hypothetical protein LTR56_018113 [Elasticomyces elasticus]KAK5748878.1 hypothetical protein LTS12_021048 [Elasticomyces elasticus]
MPKNQLPTRAEFLSNGLAPAGPMPSDFLCPILYDYSDNVVRTKCGHLYDKDAILFSLSQAEAPATTDRDVHRLVAQAMQQSGLWRFGRTAEDGISGAIIENFGIEATDSGLIRAAANAQHYLVNLDHDLLDEHRTHRALINATHLAPRIVAMANLIPAWASLNGRPHTPAQQEAWVSIVSELPAIVAGHDNGTFDTVAVPNLLRTTLDAVVSRATSQDEANAFFAVGLDDVETTPADDLSTLLNFLAWCAADYRIEVARRESWRQAAERQHKAQSQRQQGEPCSMM